MIMFVQEKELICRKNVEKSELPDDIAPNCKWQFIALL